MKIQSLKDKIALVTGSTSGIGEETAKPESFLVALDLNYGKYYDII